MEKITSIDDIQISRALNNLSKLDNDNQKIEYLEKARKELSPKTLVKICLLHFT